jgi:hypothetical protein
MDGGWEEQRLQYRFENSMGWAGVLLRVGLIPLYIMAYAGTLIVFIENVILSENVAPCWREQTADYLVVGILWQARV